MGFSYTDLCEYPLEALKSSTGYIAIDTETLGATKKTNIPIYFSWASREFGAGAGPTTTQLGYDFLSALCASPNPKIFHNAKFDLRVLRKAGIAVNGEIHDTILMHCLLDEHHLEQHRLKSLSRELLGRSRMDEFDLRREQKKVRSNLDVSQEKQHVYAKADAVDTLDLFYLFKPQLEEQNLWDLYRSEVAVEMVYGTLDESGVAVDTAAMKSATAEIGKALAELTEKIHSVFGEQFLISSGVQLGNVLAKHFPLHIRTPKTNAYKTSKDVLNPFLKDPKMQIVFAWKFLDKARSTIAGYAKREENGRLHPDYRQTTIPGRCRCSDPNLTTIPKQRGRITEVEVGSKELAVMCASAFRQARKIFIAPPGAVLVSFDWEQVEYRSLVHYSGSKRLIEKLQAGEDFHDTVCLMVFGEITPRKRHIVKVINYGLLYGMGKAYLHRMLSREGVVPGSILARYEANFPEMRLTQRRMIATAEKRGYLQDVFGRRYRFVSDFPYKIISWICQGTAANIKKNSLLRTNGPLQGKRTKLVLDVHDDLIFETYPEDAYLLPSFKREMEDFPQLDVPMTVSASTGYNLLEMHDVNVNLETDLKGLKDACKYRTNGGGACVCAQNESRRVLPDTNRTGLLE